MSQKLETESRTGKWSRVSRAAAGVRPEGSPVHSVTKCSKAMVPKEAHANSVGRSHAVDGDAVRMGKGDCKNRDEQVDATLSGSVVVPGPVSGPQETLQHIMTK